MRAAFAPLALSLCAAALPSGGGLTAQTLSVLYPRGACPGQEVEVTAYGRALADTVGALFFRPGLELLGVEPVEKRTDRVKLRIRVADDCPLGRHPVQLHTARGLTRVRTFHVAELETVTEQSEPSSLEAPQLVPLERTIDGRLLREEADCYAFDVTAGQRVVFEAEAIRLGDTDVDLELELHDDQGELLHRADDSAFGRQDPVFAWTFDRDMRARLRVRDLGWRGDYRYFYRLHVGTFPRPVVAVPSGGRPGTEVTARLLDPDGLVREVQLQVPEQSGDTDLFPSIDGRRPPTGLPFHVAGFETVVEGDTAAATDAPDDAVTAPPVAFHGVLEAPRQEDRFPVRLAKGQRLIIRSSTGRQRSPVDAVVYVRAADGKYLAGNDDGQGTDGLLRYRAPEDGRYLIGVRDHLQRGGELFAYRLEVFPESATRFVTMEAVPGRQPEDFGCAVPRGGRHATLIATRSLDRSAGVQLGLAGLPAGVVAHLPPFRAGADMVPVVFEAAGEAPLGAALSEPTAVATTGGEPGELEPRELSVRHYHQVPLLRVRNNRVADQIVIDRLPVAVCEPAPFSLEVGPLPAPVIRSAGMSLPFKVQRAEGFKGTISVRLLWSPPGLRAGTDSLRGDDCEGALSISARGDAALGNWPIVLMATARVGDVTREVSSAAVPLEVSEPWLDIAGGNGRGEQGQTLAMSLALTKKRELPGPVRLYWRRLPRGVKVVCAEELAADAERLDLKVEIAADAQLGRHRPYLDARVLTEHGEVRHIFGGYELRVDAPLPPELRARAKDDAGGGAGAGGTR